MKLNKTRKLPSETNHENTKVRGLTAEQRLSRMCMACLLWEDTFYVDGKTVAQNIEECASKVSPSYLSSLSIKTKEEGFLRHIPLFLANQYILNHKTNGANLIERLITRPDDMTELLSIYWKDGRKPLTGQLKKGLAKSFVKFDTYQLSKWNSNNKITLRDIMFLCHPKPANEKQATSWKKLAENQLEGADTWESRLSAGKDKKESFIELMRQGRLGYMAFLKNLRNMIDAGVPLEELETYAREKAGKKKILPFQFIKALQYAPALMDALDEAMINSVDRSKKLLGHTALLVDVSGSMFVSMSAQAETTLIDAACGLAILARELCQRVDVYSFSNELVQIHPFRGFALSHAIKNSQPHGGTYIGKALRTVQQQRVYDRTIIITDAQSFDQVGNPQKNGYMVNIASYKNGVGYGPWHQINGFSPHVFKYINEIEKEEYECNQ